MDFRGSGHAILIFVLVLLNAISIAASVSVSGRMPNAGGKEVRLIIFKDHISKAEHTISRDSISGNGRFRLEAEIDRITYAQLVIEFNRGDIYLKPGFDHLISIEEIDFSEKVHPQFAKSLVINFENVDSNDLNLNIQQLNILTNQFLIENSKTFHQPKTKLRIDSLENYAYQRFDLMKDSYFSTYFEYRFAFLKNSVKNTSLSKSASDIANRHIHYDHVEYMDYFNDIFSQYLLHGTRAIKPNEIYFTVNHLRDYFALMDTVGKDTILFNEKLRELVILRSLKEFYYQGSFDRSGILKVLHQIGEQSKFDLHRAIASNLIEVLTAMQEGFTIPRFALPDVSGKVFSLDSLKGKFTYLFFWNTWCRACLSEMELMKELYREFIEDIRFVAINTDREFMTMYHFVLKDDYPWHSLHFDGQFGLLEDFAVSTYPAFVLIDREGRLLRYPASKPSENAGEVFQKLIPDP